jgi:hypothetical protein
LGVRSTLSIPLLLADDALCSAGLEDASRYVGQRRDSRPWKWSSSAVGREPLGISEKHECAVSGNLKSYIEVIC